MILPVPQVVVVFGADCGGQVCQPHRGMSRVCKYPKRENMSDMKCLMNCLSKTPRESASNLKLSQRCSFCGIRFFFPDILLFHDLSIANFACLCDLLANCGFCFVSCIENIGSEPEQQ
jgi:hypothetical protein